MNDLVDRLRRKAGIMEMGERIPWGSDTALMREAADEIERLRAEIEALRPDAERYRELRGKMLVGSQPGSFRTISDGVIDAMRSKDKS